MNTDLAFAIIMVAFAAGILVGFYARTTDKDMTDEVDE